MLFPGVVIPISVGRTKSTKAVRAAYKKDIDDMRESPSLRLIELFEREGEFESIHNNSKHG